MEEKKKGACPSATSLPHTLSSPGGQLRQRVTLRLHCCWLWDQPKGDANLKRGWDLLPCFSPLFPQWRLQGQHSALHLSGLLSDPSHLGVLQAMLRLVPSPLATLRNSASPSLSPHLSHLKYVFSPALALSKTAGTPRYPEKPPLGKQGSLSQLVLSQGTRLLGAMARVDSPSALTSLYLRDTSLNRNYYRAQNNNLS